jgi:predicted RNA-binding Zn ribbon-like protein
MSEASPHLDAAPGDLALVHAFLNTRNAAGPRERFDSPERLEDWLRKRALVAADAHISEADFTTVRALRETLRELIAAPVDTTAAREKANAIAQSAPLVVRFDADAQPGLEPAGPGAAGAMARILAIIATARSDGTWQRMKLCRNHECQRVFYDTSKNRSAVWCSSRSCGNRMNIRAHRERAASRSRAEP